MIIARIISREYGYKYIFIGFYSPHFYLTHKKHRAITYPIDTSLYILQNLAIGKKFL